MINSTQIVIDGIKYNIRPTPELYIPPAPYHVQRGKRAFLNGEPEPTVPARCTHSQDQCDFIMGWHVAQSQRANHPEWSDQYILA